jgi:hypothetical protein
VDCVCEGAAMAAFAAQNVAPPPPPPVEGSAQWLKSTEHVLVAPGPEAAQSGLNMAMYQAGPLAVNLADYLRHKADEEEVRTRVRASCRTCGLWPVDLRPVGGVMLLPVLQGCGRLRLTFVWHSRAKLNCRRSYSIASSNHSLVS